jgi:hypothetical protein
VLSLLGAETVPICRASILTTLAASLAVAQSLAPFGKITFYGLHPVNVGMTPPEASAALGDTLVPYERTPATETCYLVHPKNTPSLLFMVEEGRVVRV